MSKNVTEDLDFVSESVKQGIVLDLMRAKAKENINDREIEALLDCSEPYTFTVDELVAIAAKLKRRPVIRLISKDECMPIIPVRRLKDFRKWLNCDHYADLRRMTKKAALKPSVSSDLRAENERFAAAPREREVDETVTKENDDEWFSRTA